MPRSLKDTETLAGALAWQDCSENGPDANLEEKPRLEYPAQLDKVILKKAKRGAQRGAREATATVQWAAVTAAVGEAAAFQLLVWMPKRVQRLASGTPAGGSGATASGSDRRDALSGSCYRL